MSLREVRDSLYDIVSMFFGEDSVYWTEQINTKPTLPYVTIKLGEVHRTTFPVNDPAIGRCYHCRTIAEINLYTEGRPATAEEDSTGNYENTATSDLMEFSIFLESDGVIDILSKPRIDVSLNGPVRDLSFLEHDRQHRYRAMAEYNITFVMKAGGRYAMDGMPDVPNYSGGGTKPLAEEPTETIEEAEIEEIT